MGAVNYKLNSFIYHSSTDMHAIQIRTAPMRRIGPAEISNVLVLKPPLPNIFSFEWLPCKYFTRSTQNL